MELGLAFAAHGPIDISQMVGHGGVHRHQFGGAFHMAHGLVIAAKAIERPAKAVDDIAAVWPCLDRAFNHIKRFGQVLLFFDQRIAHIVQHAGMIGVQFQGAAEIGLGLGPIVQPLITDPTGMQDKPLRPVFGIVQRKRAVIGGYGIDMAGH